MFPSFQQVLGTYPTLGALFEVGLLGETKNKTKQIIMKKFKWMGESNDCITNGETYEVTRIIGEKIYFFNDYGEEDWFERINKNIVEAK